MASSRHIVPALRASWRRAASTSAQTSRLAPITNGFVGAVGNTPLIRLNKYSQETGCEILGKAEFMNPGGSVKDRAALGLVQDAEDRGLVTPGGTIVEGTAGNTGIGLAHVCRSKGYKCVIYMPETQSQEKIDLLRMLGAEVFPVPAVAYENPQNYNHQAKRHAEQTKNSFWTDQFDSTANRKAHLLTTGPEIWSQTSLLPPTPSGSNLPLDGFTCATGTGGTLAGVTRYLKEKSDGRVKCWLADPPGSVLYGYIQNGKQKLGDRIGTSITEGIGQGRVTGNLQPDIDLLDNSMHIPDSASLETVFRLLDEEGLYVGASSALNVAAAVEMAKQLGPGHRIVTVICDGAARYQGRLFSKKWVQSKGLYDGLPDSLKKYIILP